MIIFCENNISMQFHFLKEYNLVDIKKLYWKNNFKKSDWGNEEA